MRTKEERLNRLQRGNERIVEHTMKRIAPLGLRAFFLLLAYGVCIIRGLVYAIGEPFLRWRDRILGIDYKT
jgi:hypothetical protein